MKFSHVYRQVKNKGGFISQVEMITFSRRRNWGGEWCLL